MIRSRSTSASGSPRPMLGRGQQQGRPQEGPQEQQVERTPGSVQAPGRIVFDQQYPVSHELMQYATTSLQGGKAGPAPTGQKTNYSDFVKSHENDRPCREPLGLPPAKGPDRKAFKYRKPPVQGMIKDLTRILQDHMEVTPELGHYTHDERASMARQVTNHMVDHKVEWLLDREKNPLKYMRYVSDLFLKFSGVRLRGLDTYVKWIKAGTFIHGTILK